MARDEGGRFLKGHRGGGRNPGARNRLQKDVIEAMLESWAKNGKAALEIMFREKPAEYARLITSTLPKEYVTIEGSLGDLTDEEVAEALAQIRKAREATINDEAAGSA
jgi:hypothetical protein